MFNLILHQNYLYGILIFNMFLLLVCFYWFHFLLLIIFPAIKGLAASDHLENQLVSLVNILQLHSGTGSGPQLLFEKQFKL